MRDFWSGDITHRELWTLIKHLPDESRFKQSLAGADERRAEELKQQHVEERHAALEAQWARNQQRTGVT